MSGEESRQRVVDALAAAEMRAGCPPAKTQQQEPPSSTANVAAQVVAQPQHSQPIPSGSLPNQPALPGMNQHRFASNQVNYTTGHPCHGKSGCCADVRKLKGFGNSVGINFKKSLFRR